MKQAPRKSKKRIKGSLIRDIQRKFWIDLLKVRIKYKPSWKDLIIATLIGFIFGLLGHSTRALTEPTVNLPILTTKPASKLKQADLKPQEQLASIAVEPAYVAPISSVISGCGDNFYANFIYMHESGCNASAINSSSGAGGIGQALPFSKTGCALGDYGCQNAWFTAYANSTYGSWAGAYSFWQAHSWW